MGAVRRLMKMISQLLIPAALILNLANIHCFSAFIVFLGHSWRPCKMGRWCPSVRPLNLNFQFGSFSLLVPIRSLTTVFTNFRVFLSQGESSVYAFEVATDHPHLFPLSTWKAEGLQQSLSFLPKNECNVRGVEFAKGYRLTANSVEPVSFAVPRVKVEPSIPPSFS